MSTRRILGTLHPTGATGSPPTGTVRIEDTVDTTVDDLWSALTDPARLARWYGTIDGPAAAVGDEFRLDLHASGWTGRCRIEACERPTLLRVATEGDGEDGTGEVEVRLVAHGDRTRLVWEERGVPLDLLAQFGAGVQVHVEDLREHLAGRGRTDATALWQELLPAYRRLADRA